MSISMIGFTANDAMTKTVSASMNMGQVMLLRGLFATVLIMLLAWSQGALRNPRQALHPLVALRSASEALATITFLVALAKHPARHHLGSAAGAAARRDDGSSDRFRRGSSLAPMGGDRRRLHRRADHRQAGQ